MQPELAASRVRGGTEPCKASWTSSTVVRRRPLDLVPPLLPRTESHRKLRFSVTIMVLAPDIRWACSRLMKCLQRVLSAPAGHLPPLEAQVGHNAMVCSGIAIVHY